MNFENPHFEFCPLCKRVVYSRDMVNHHWLPKSKKRKRNGNTLRICDTCHRVIHFLIPVEYIHYFPSIESLQNLSELQPYFQYIQTLDHPHKIPIKKIKFLLTKKISFI
ncbi:MAG: hypothetical protein NZZ41_04670 [Candidatus Dojkabacteria bacterium]|nr:hypothetical protein [Candidatus Dojkabacteria bacterium]